MAGVLNAAKPFTFTQIVICHQNISSVDDLHKGSLIVSKDVATPGRYTFPPASL